MVYLIPQSSECPRFSLAVYEWHLHPEYSQEGVRSIFFTFRFSMEGPPYYTFSVENPSFSTVLDNVTWDLSLASNAIREDIPISYLLAICRKEY